MADTGTITLISRDGQRFVVEKKVAFMSGFIRELLKCSPDITEIPLNTISGPVLQKVIEFCKSLSVILLQSSVCCLYRVHLVSLSECAMVTFVF